MKRISSESGVALKSPTMTGGNPEAGARSRMWLAIALTCASRMCPSSNRQLKWVTKNGKLSERSIELGKNQTARLFGIELGQLERLRAKDGKLGEHRVAEAEVARLHRDAEGDVVAEPVGDLQSLVEPIARCGTKHLLQPDDVGLEIGHARANGGEALFPRAAAVPDVQGDDTRRAHAPKLARDGKSLAASERCRRR